MNNEFSQDFYLGYFEAKAVFRAFFCEKIGVIPVMYSCLMLKGSWHGQVITFAYVPARENEKIKAVFSEITAWIKCFIDISPDVLKA